MTFDHPQYLPFLDHQILSRSIVLVFFTDDLGGIEFASVEAFNLFHLRYEDDTFEKLPFPMG